MTTTLRKAGVCVHCGKDALMYSTRNLCCTCNKDKSIRVQYLTARQRRSVPPDKRCRNCQESRINRPRRLCWTCYYTPGVIEKHPSTSKFARRGVGHAGTRITLPEPTTALPGTPEKFQVLCQRAENNQSLWHPDDAQWESVPDADDFSSLLLREVACA